MSTDARLLALRYYRASARHLQTDLAALAANPTGVVLWSPRLVVLMKAAHSQQPQEWLHLAVSPQQADSWYVHLLAGDLSLARRLACMVPEHRWVCFQRGRRSAAPHRLPWQRVVCRTRI